MLKALNAKWIQLFSDVQLKCSLSNVSFRSVRFVFMSLRLERQLSTSLCERQYCQKENVPPPSVLPPVDLHGFPSHKNYHSDLGVIIRLVRILSPESSSSSCISRVGRSFRVLWFLNLFSSPFSSSTSPPVRSLLSRVSSPGVSGGREARRAGKPPSLWSTPRWTITGPTHAPSETRLMSTAPRPHTLCSRSRRRVRWWTYHRESFNMHM